MSDGSIGHEESQHHGAFFYELGGKRLGVMTYNRLDPALVVIDHTEVDPSLGGKGIGRKMLDAAVAWARETNTKVRATCPFASARFAKDPSIRDVLAE